MSSIHTVFDFLAVTASLAVTVCFYNWRLNGPAQRISAVGFGYGFALLFGAVIGGYGFGTLNLWLSQDVGIGRSIVGSLAGGICAVEFFKWMCGIAGSTGIVFVPAFATTVTVGRWGCYLSGLDDHTYGVVTKLPWGKDFGDGVLRHPVQLYESFSMLAFLIVATVLIGKRNPWFMQNGFYMMVLFYAVQRFVWEFLKPYGAALGPLNLFHLVCLALAGYAVFMMRGQNGRVVT